MNYMKVKWIHSIPDEPVLLYSEIDDDRWELRKIEVYQDGKTGFAGPGVAHGGSKLSKEPLPSLSQIAGDPQFEPSAISQPEFEAAWDKATSG